MARILSFIAELGTTVGRVVDTIATSAGSIARVAGISESITIRVVTIAGRSVQAGLGGAVSNVGVTEILDPGADIETAAEQGFIGGVAFGGLGQVAGVALKARNARAAAAAVMKVPGTDKTISTRFFNETYASSVHQMDSPAAMLGKYLKDSPEGYIQRAGNDHAYFDMGSRWNEITSDKSLNLDDNDMFALFNTKFLDENIAAGKPFHFSHNPKDYPNTALRSELDYLEAHGYEFSSATMTAVKL